jgi:hypothetical protein
MATYGNEEETCSSNVGQYNKKLATNYFFQMYLRKVRIFGGILYSR